MATLPQNYTFYDLGYNQNLVKPDSFYDETPAMASVISDAVNPVVISGGELASNLSMVDGFLGIEKATYSDTTAGFWVGLDGTTPKLNLGDDTYSLTWDGTTLTVTGTITADAGTIGGWNIVSGYIYNLQSGTPTASPNDGIVMASGNEAIICYEDTAKRLELGYLSAGVYGLRIYDTGGSNVIYETSDTQQNIAGWYFTTTTLADNATAASANILIDSANGLVRAGATSGNYLTIDGANLRIRSSNYVTGSAGAGFTLEPDLLETGNIACRGIIRTAVFQKDIINVIAGSFVIAPNADVLATTMTAED